MLRIRRYDGDLVIENPTDSIKDFLTYVHKQTSQKNGQFTTEKIPTSLWAPVDGEPNSIITYQGLFQDLVAFCKRKGIKGVVRDLRWKCPGPDIRKAKGFRCRQLQLFLAGLHKNQSGIFEAPTRYGKSTIIFNLCRVYPGLPTVITLPGLDLVKQLAEELKVALPDREIKLLCTGSRDKVQSQDITVVNMDSLHRINPEQVRLLLVDEAHAAAAASRIPYFSSFKNARIYGLAATPEGRFDNADVVVKGLIGPVLARRTFPEAVAEGAICNIKVWMVRFPIKPGRYRDRNKAYAALVHNNRDFLELVQRITREIVPADWQTLVFIDTVAQATVAEVFVDESVKAIASQMTKKQRAETYRAVVANETKRCICTTIYAQGVTFPDIRVIVNASGGGGSITGVQKPGRLAQIRPGKSCGHMIDFLFYEAEDNQQVPSHEQPEETPDGPWKLILFDSAARLKTYTKKGYEIHVVDNVNQIVLD